jgi:hypothetical protein
MTRSKTRSGRVYNKVNNAVVRKTRKTRSKRRSKTRSGRAYSNVVRKRRTKKGGSILLLEKSGKLLVSAAKSNSIPGVKQLLNIDTGGNFEEQYVQDAYTHTTNETIKNLLTNKYITIYPSIFDIAPIKYVLPEAPAGVVEKEMENIDKTHYFSPTKIAEIGGKDNINNLLTSPGNNGTYRYIIRRGTNTDKLNEADTYVLVFYSYVQKIIRQVKFVYGSVTNYLFVSKNLINKNIVLPIVPSPIKRFENFLDAVDPNLKEPILESLKTPEGMERSPSREIVSTDDEMYANAEGIDLQHPISNENATPEGEAEYHTRNEIQKNRLHPIFGQELYEVPP